MKELPKFTHVVGHMDRNGKVIWPLGYRIEQFFYRLRQVIAFMICPELRWQIQKERYNLDYIIQVRKEQAHECRARDKAIARLQQKIKDLNFLLKRWKIPLPKNNKK